MAYPLIAYIALVPLLGGLVSQGAHDLSRWLQLLLVVLCLGMQAIKAQPTRILVERACLLLVLAALASLSIASAPKSGPALREMILSVALVASAHGISRWALPRAAVVGLIGAQALYAAAVLSLLVAGLVIDHVVSYMQLPIGYDNIRFLNHVQALAAPLFVAFVAMPGLRRRWHVLATLALVFCLFTTSLLQARATTVAYLAVSIAAPVAFGRAGRTFALRMGGAAVAGVLLHLSVMRGIPWLMEIEFPAGYRAYDEISSVDARIFLLRTAWDDIVAHPWLGIGPMHFAHYFNGEAAHPHNIYAQVTAEVGVPFSILLFGCVARAMWGAARTIRTKLRDDMLAIGSYLAVLAALVDGCFSGNFVMPVSQMWIVLAVGILLSKLRSVAEPVEPSTRTWTIPHWLVRTGFGLLLVGQLWLIAVSWPEFRMANPVIASPGQPIKSEHYSPRFWRDGWF